MQCVYIYIHIHTLLVMDLQEVGWSKKEGGSIWNVGLSCFSFVTTTLFQEQCNQIDLLTPSPLPEDALLCAVPVTAPYSAMAVRTTLIPSLAESLSSLSFCPNFFRFASLEQTDLRRHLRNLQGSTLQHCSTDLYQSGMCRQTRGYMDFVFLYIHSESDYTYVYVCECIVSVHKHQWSFMKVYVHLVWWILWSKRARSSSVCFAYTW